MVDFKIIKFFKKFPKKHNKFKKTTVSLDSEELSKSGQLQKCSFKLDTFNQHKITIKTTCFHTVPSPRTSSPYLPPSTYFCYCINTRNDPHFSFSIHHFLYVALRATRLSASTKVNKRKVYYFRIFFFFHLFPPFCFSGFKVKL